MCSLFSNEPLRFWQAALRSAAVAVGSSMPEAPLETRYRFDGTFLLCFETCTQWSSTFTDVLKNQLLEQSLAEFMMSKIFPNTSWANSLELSTPPNKRLVKSPSSDRSITSTRFPGCRLA